MVQHYNPSIAIRAHRLLNSKGNEFLPNEVSGPVVTLPLDPICKILASQVRTASGSNGFFTTNADKDTYLTGAIFDVVKDSTCDVASGSLIYTVVQDGATVNICRISVLTLTAERQSVFVTFPGKGLKLDPNTAVSFGSNTFTVGNMVRGCVLYGYTDEVKTN